MGFLIGVGIKTYFYGFLEGNENSSGFGWSIRFIQVISLMFNEGLRVIFIFYPWAHLWRFIRKIRLLAWLCMIDQRTNVPQNPFLPKFREISRIEPVFFAYSLMRLMRSVRVDRKMNKEDVFHSSSSLVSRLRGIFLGGLWVVWVRGIEAPFFEALYFEQNTGCPSSYFCVWLCERSRGWKGLSLSNHSVEAEFGR